MTSGPARRIADELGRRGLAIPARLLGDAHRPMAPLLSDVAAATGPLLAAAVGHRADDLRALAEDPAGLDDLIKELEAPRADAR